MYYQTTPFASIKNVAQKVRAIVSEDYKIKYPPCDNPLLLDVLKQCLQRDPKKRPTTNDLLNHPFLQ